MSMVGPITTGAATGGAGAATATVTTTTEVGGLLYGVYIRYNDSPPATTDVTVATHATNFPGYNLLVVTNANTDGLFLPRKAVVDAAGAAFASQSVAAAMPVDGRITVTVAQANDGDSVDVWLFLGY